LTPLRPRKQYFWGIVALIFGFLFGALSTWNLIDIANAITVNHVFDIWFVIGRFWIFGLAIYLIFVGLHKTSIYNPVSHSTISRIGWGRVIVGTYLIYSALLNHFRPVPNGIPMLQPSNETQAMAMKATENVLNVLMPLLGAYLAVAGVRKGFKQSDKVDPNTNNASQSASN
jgi:ABC-type multidrug transport system fused ATPase/permease subunit